MRHEILSHCNLIIFYLICEIIRIDITEIVRKCVFYIYIIMESVDNLEKFLADIWLNIATLLRESVVYIDHAAIECLHWYTGGTGYIFLKNAGAVAVYELAMYNSNVCVINKHMIFILYIIGIIALLQITLPCYSILLRKIAKMQLLFQLPRIHSFISIRLK